MTGEAVVTRLKNIEEIAGADKIVQAKILGETVITSKDNVEGTLGVLFDCETLLSEEFVRKNNMFRHSELNDNKEIVGMFDDVPRVRPIRLRGVKCSAFFMPLDGFEYTGLAQTLKENDKFTELGAFKICEKYIPKQKEKGSSNQPKAIKVNYVPAFKEHNDTDHILKSVPDIPVGRFVITKKLHGTSARYAKLPARNPTLLERLKNRSKNPNQKLLNRALKYNWFTSLVAKIPQFGQKFEYRNVVGSRTVVKSVEGLFENPNQGFYEEDLWSTVSHKTFGDNLLKGETVYFEIVGYEKSGKGIMTSSNTKSLEKFVDKTEYKDAVAKFGQVVEWNYGVPKGEADVYVYRITNTNADGEAIDLSWEQVKKRCEKLDVKHVPEMYEGKIVGHLAEDKTLKTLLFDDEYANQKFAGMDLATAVDAIANEADHNGTYPEGICLRVEGYPNCKIWKHKTYGFKVLEGIIKDKGETSLEEEN